MEANSRQLNNFEQNIAKFKRNIIDRGYPEMLIQETLSEVKFENRNAALTPKPKENWQTKFVFCNTIPTISAELKTNPHE